jgi:hypothetical protein
LAQNKVTSGEPSGQNSFRPNFEFRFSNFDFPPFPLLFSEFQISTFFLLCFFTSLLLLHKNEIGQVRELQACPIQLLVGYG